jgi:hypothetical protein
MFYDEDYELEINATNFPDEHFRAFLMDSNNILGFGTDGKLTANELYRIDEIEISDSNIVDITGIEHFSALSYFYLSNTKVLSLDLRKLKNLLSVLCDGNALKTLMLSELSNLREIFCSENNLEEIDVRGCASLHIINCLYNELSYIDLTDCVREHMVFTGTNQEITMTFTGDSENGYSAARDFGIEPVFTCGYWDPGFDITYDSDTKMLSLSNNDYDTLYFRSTLYNSKGEPFTLSGTIHLIYNTVLTGDTNGDGLVTAADALLLLRNLVGLASLSESGLKAADVNGDGFVTAADAALILRAIVGLAVIN